VHVQVCAIAGDDAGGLLAAMLEGVEAEIGEIGSFGMAENAKDTTLVVEMIVEVVVYFHAIFFAGRFANL